jgi:hypothetical protein
MEKEMVVVVIMEVVVVIIMEVVVIIMEVET